MNQQIERPSSRLRIAVIGVGGIGSTFAFQLSRTGRHEVTVIARPGSARLRQLERDGGIVNTKDERADVLITDKLEEAIPYDLVIVTLLAYQVEAVLPALQRSCARWIQFMFNNFDPERLRDAVGAERCSFGMPFVQGSLDRDGRLKAKIGAGGQKSKMNDERCVGILEAAGLPAVLERDMLLWLRCHVPLCIAFESVCVEGERRKGGASWSESLVIAQGMQEGFTLVQRLGYKLYRRVRYGYMHAPSGWRPVCCGLCPASVHSVSYSRRASMSVVRWSMCWWRAPFEPSPLSRSRNSVR